MTDVVKDKAWIAQASLQELQDAIRSDPVDSPLFGLDLAEFFWTTYRSKVAELYRTQPVLKNEGFE